MPIIPYRATNFTGEFLNLNGNGQVDVTWSQLVWAAVTVGKATGDEYAHHVYSAQERSFRTSMMYAYLYASSSDHLQQTMPYIASDPTEKGWISYHTGMILAKLFAEVLFNVPRMLHLFVYGGNYQIDAQPGDSRPDLIGLAHNGAWFVFEAKGSSNGFGNTTLNTAKAQAERITQINGIAPLCIASQSYFSASGLRFRMDDPEPPSRRRPKPQNLTATRDKFERDYYAPIRAIIASRGSDLNFFIADLALRGTRIEEADFVVALSEPAASETNMLETKPNFSSEYLGNDGVFIGLGSSWSEENMKLQPHQRSG